MVLYATSPANRDPDRFNDPDEFDIDRRPTKLLTFGKGVHFCLGSHLARAEMQVALQVLLDRLQGLRLTVGEKPLRVSATLRGPRAMRVSYDAILPRDTNAWSSPC